MEIRNIKLWFRKNDEHKKPDWFVRDVFDLNDPARKLGQRTISDNDKFADGYFFDLEALDRLFQYIRKEDFSDNGLWYKHDLQSALKVLEEESK